MASEQVTSTGGTDDPLFTLSMDDGAGALIAAAAGDVAGRADETSYSAVTQEATVLSYHLLVNDEVDRERLAAELLELAGGKEGRFTYRSPAPEFEEWLRSSLRGNANVSAARSSAPATRTLPIGVFMRRRPDDLVRAAINAVRVSHLDAATATAAAATAGAVAGSCFVQAGADLVLGAAETADRAQRLIEDEPYRYGDVTAGAAVGSRLRDLALLAAEDPTTIVSSISGEGEPTGVTGAILGIVLGAASRNDPMRLIEAGAAAGGSVVGAIAGAVVGARSGLVQWPWRVQNDTWFAELGRRLVAGPSEVRDLPIPYAVEERMLMAARTRASEETI